MKLCKNTTILLSVFLSLLAMAADPNTWWVDEANYGAAVQDGSEAHPFGTILAAVTNSACVNGDMIKVKPGIYDKDFYEVTNTISDVDFVARSRIYIAKKVNIVATGTKEETHIVGRFCPVDEGGHAVYKSGPTAVRCISVVAAGKGSTLTGFTIRDGATISYAGGSQFYNRGGAIGVSDASKDFYVTDCVISNCLGRYYGGAASGGTFNRCRISDCRAYASGAAFYHSAAINSVIVNCRLVTADGDISATYLTLCSGDSSQSKMVNCTFYGNGSPWVTTSDCYNCLFAGNYCAKSAETNGVSINASNVYASDGREYRTAGPGQMFAPALGDYHPLPDSAAIGTGDPSYLSTITLPAGTELRDMDGNLIDTNAAHIAAGAYQTPKTPKYGGVLVTSPASIDGAPAYGTNIFYAATWPISVKVVPSSGTYRIAVSGETTDDIISRYTGKDGYVAITPPYAAGAVQTNTCTFPSTTVVRYVNAVSGSDSNAGSSASKAFKTIQKAVDNFTKTSYGYTIYVAEGEYDTGGGVARGVTNRINCTTARYIRFIATGSRDKTIIRGAAAKNERDPENHPGCGPDAVRCVSYSYSSSSANQMLVFVGFTFADGHTDCGQDASNDICGAAYGRGYKSDGLQFIDCVFTNCYAPAAGIASRSHFTRCRFIDCGSGAEGLRYSILNSSVVENGSFGTGVFGTVIRAVNCSVANSNALVAGATDQILLNCALGDGDTLPSSVTTWGSTVYSCFADAENGDLRFVAGSPALDAARREFPSQGGSGWSAFKYFSDFASDYPDGKPWVFSGGFPVAGVYFGRVPGLSLALDPAIYSITGAKSGGNLLSPGDTVTISRLPSAVRHYGVSVDGVTNMLDSGSLTFTVPAAEEMDNMAIDQVLDQNWYVNPDPESGASDANNGFTPDTAKLTLAGVLSVATNAGDVVNAYPGTYSNGEMRISATAPHASRAIVPAKVTLKATGSAEETIILGAASDAPAANTYGMGTNAVRCVALRANAVIDGFTLTGGRTLNVSSISGDNAYKDLNAAGGGAAGVEMNTTALVKNCVISNNFGMYGGGGYYCRYQKCKVLGNRATTSGSGIYRSGIVSDCFADNNYGTYTIMYPSGVYNCTIGYNNGNRGTYFYQPSAEAYKVFNSIVYRPGNNQSVYWNCALGNDCGTVVSAANLLHGSFSTNVAALKLDANYMPSVDSPVVDAGDDAKRGSLFPETDINGVPRVLNGGRFDIGAYEYDWRKTYSEDLGKGVEVFEVTSNVVDVAKTVRVPEGSLSLEWAINGGCLPMFDAEVEGDGALEILVGGEAFATLTAADGHRTLTLPAQAGTLRLDFNYSGDGYAALSNFDRHAGFLLIIR